MRALFAVFLGLSGLLAIDVSPATITTAGEGPWTTKAITLLSFKGQAGPEGVILEWASAAEKNFDFYSIERSVDGLNFETISIVKGAGTAVQGLDYSYVDRNPRQGVGYYRLRSVDLDGRLELLNVVRVNWGQAGTIM